mgnify:CR=1 FL=1
MDSESIAIRRGRPTTEDCIAFARFADEVTEGGLSVLPDHDLSYEHTLFAEHNGAIVGMACDPDPPGIRPSHRYLLYMIKSLDPRESRPGVQH